MKAVVDEQDVHWWRKRFTDALMDAPTRALAEKSEATV
jgi:hypothetical protein